jgi:serine phosphatase RsbU (regulator of sigma subunit)
MGQRFKLDPARTVIGRGEKCDVRLVPLTAQTDQSPAVSKIHAVITCEDQRFYIADGNGAERPSRNHTYVNDVCLELPGRRLLKNGDTIRICSHILVFEQKGPAPDTDSSSVDASVSPHDTSVLLAHPAEKLAAVVVVIELLRHTLELDELLPQVLEILLDVFRQAKRAFLLLANESTGDLEARFFKAQGQRTLGERGFSATIVRRCVSTMTGLLSNDPESQFPESESVAGLALRSVMCAPLWIKEDKAFGALLLDCDRPLKPFSEQDLNLLVGIANTVSTAFAIAQHHQDALLLDRYRRDMALARNVAMSFLPERLPETPDYEFFASYESALEVGGDYYDVIPLPGERHAVLVGDVSGKGVSAALIMARFSAQVQACLRTEPDLAAAVRQLNRLVEALGLTDRFITFAVLVVDPATHIVTAVNAGHPLPLLLRRATGKLEDLDGHAICGVPLGIMTDYTFESYRFTLEPGDNVVLFSDGVSEAMDVTGQQLGTRGLRKLLEQGGASLCELGERILQGVEKHAAGCPQHDDITLVCFGRKG